MSKQPEFEKLLARLEEIVSLLDQGDLPLEKCLALFQEGTKLTKICRQILQEAQNQVQIYTQGVLEDFDQPKQEE